MYLEVSEKKYQALIKKLEEKGIAYSVKDCSILKDPARHYHLDFGNLSPETAKELYVLYVQASNEVHEPVKKNKWLEKYHTPVEEAVGYITGKSTEETYEYE